MVRLELDRVHHLRARPPGGLDSQADLDGFDRLDAHDGAGQPGVELAVPLGVASQTDRAAGDDRLDDAAQGVAGIPRGIDRGDDRRIGLGVQGVDRAGIANRRVERKRRRGDPTQLSHITKDGDAELGEQKLGQRAAATRSAVSRRCARSSTWRMPV